MPLSAAVMELIMCSTGMNVAFVDLVMGGEFVEGVKGV